MLKVMLVDDDHRMQKILIKALGTFEEIAIEVVASSGNEGGVEAYMASPVDVAFLDVDMPGINGVETAKLILDINPKCAIVFITAHEDYMKEAFELYAFDYIMKLSNLKGFIKLSIDC